MMLGCVASAITASPLRHYHRCLYTDVADEQHCLEYPSTPVLKDDLGLDRDLVIGAVECFHEVSVFLGHKVTPYLTGPGQLPIIRIEFLGQNEEAPDLRPGHLRILCQARIDPGNFSLNEVVNLLASARSV